MIVINRILLFSAFVLIGLWADAQDFKMNDIEIKSVSHHQGRIALSRINNHYNGEVRVVITNEYGPSKRSISIGSNGHYDFPGTITCNRVQACTASGDKLFDIYYEPKPIEQSEIVVIDGTPEKEEKEKPQPIINNPQQPKGIDYKPLPMTNKKSLGIEDIITGFNNYLESIPYLSNSAISEEKTQIENHINNLRNWKDKDAYISEHHLNKYVNANNDTLTMFKKNITSMITDYMGLFGNKVIMNKKECIDSIQAILENRLAQRELNTKRLSDEMNVMPNSIAFDRKIIDWKLLGVSISLASLLVILLYVWFRKANNKNKITSLSKNSSNNTIDSSSAIVVRRKTTSILRKQNLDDVIENNAYLKIDCNDFCNDSAVKMMYIKNTCIKDIYNMYAEDLRNPNNPKEDGCMVLGRWVYNKESGEYDVSLEQIVFPGDDAVFSEYELNFGGKIKLKIREKLRKLRKETDLQYDLTCWVHSHPGLGVFFSNSDSNVQMQLKDPIHPHFLTAIVVDILTPQQELGIFTFKRDSSINSKADLKKMYSLEDLYKWAVESDRNTIKPKDYFNTLAEAKNHSNNCYGIELSNGAIIDMGKLTEEHTTGLVSMVHGFSNQQGLKTMYYIEAVSNTKAVPDYELSGCFIIATHCSIPSIRKAVACHIDKINFVLVYTTIDGLLTTIPIINYEICTEETYYGEQKLEDLKIWTRRKR